MKYVCMDDRFYIALCTITGVTLRCLLLSFITKPLNLFSASICRFLFLSFFKKKIQLKLCKYHILKYHRRT